MGAARTIAARPLRGVKAAQARQEDLLDTSTPGGLTEVKEELRALRHLLSGGTNQEHEEGEDESPEMDDSDKPAVPDEKSSWLDHYRRSRKGHGGAGGAKESETVRETPHILPPGRH